MLAPCLDPLTGRRGVSLTAPSSISGPTEAPGDEVAAAATGAVTLKHVFVVRPRDRDALTCVPCVTFAESKRAEGKEHPGVALERAENVHDVMVGPHV